MTIAQGMLGVLIGACIFNIIVLASLYIRREVRRIKERVERGEF